MAGGPSRKKQGQAGATGMSNGWRQKQTAVAMPRATCPPPRSLSSLAPSTARHEAYCRTFKPQDPRPTSPENLPTDFAPLNSSTRNSVARQLLFEPVVVLSCVQQLGATSSIACSCDWFGCRPPAPGAWECRRPHASRGRRCITTATTGSSSGGFYRVPEHHQRSQQWVVHMHEQ